MREKQANTQSFLFETDEYNLPGFQGSVKFGDTHSGRNRSALVKDCFSKKQTYDKGCESSLHTSLNDAIFVPRPEVVTAARKSASRLSKQKPSITIAFSFRRKPWPQRSEVVQRWEGRYEHLPDLHLSAQSSAHPGHSFQSSSLPLKYVDADSTVLIAFVPCSSLIIALTGIRGVFQIDQSLASFLESLPRDWQTCHGYRGVFDCVFMDESNHYEANCWAPLVRSPTLNTILGCVAAGHTKMPIDCFGSQVARRLLYWRMRAGW